MAKAKIHETAKVIQMPGTERSKNASGRSNDPLVTSFYSLPSQQQQIWRNVMELAALANKKGYYPGLPYLVGGDEKLFGKNAISGLIPGGVPVIL